MHPHTAELPPAPPRDSGPPSDQTPGRTHESLLGQPRPTDRTAKVNRKTGGTGTRGQGTGTRGPGTRSLKLSRLRSPPQQHTRPQPSSPLSWLLCPLFPLFPDTPPLTHPHPPPPLPVASQTPFGSSMNILMCFPGGRGGLCAGRLHWLWHQRPSELAAPGRTLQGQSCPPAQASTSKANQTPPPPLPPLCCVGGNMTGRDMVPSGHSQLTAVNDSTHAGGGGGGVWDVIVSPLPSGKL